MSPPATIDEVLAEKNAVHPELYHPVAVNDTTALTPEPNVDFFEIVEFHETPRTATVIDTRVVATNGTACANATNGPSCLSKVLELTTLVPEAAWREECYSCDEIVGRYIVYGIGDRVAATAEASFFGTIDSSIEAAWVGRGTSVRTVGNHYEVLTTVPVDGCREIQYDVTEVAPNGTAALVKRERFRGQNCRTSVPSTGR